MQLETTASHSVTRTSQEEPPPTNYLINTAKAVKGHKLKTRDFIKLQMMRFRKCSPVKFDDLHEKSPPPHC